MLLALVKHGKIGGLINLNSLFQNILSVSSTGEPQLSEVERLLAEIEEAKRKIKCAWNHLDYAAPEYVEIAVLELLIAETQYSLLIKRYRLLLGINKRPCLCTSALKTTSFLLHDHIQNHAFYRTLSNPLMKIPHQEPHN